MRFTTRDLLFITAFVAIYAAMAGAGLFGSATDLARAFLPGINGTLFVALCAWVVLGRVRSDAGAHVCNLRVRLPWSYHLFVAGFILAIGLMYRASDADHSVARAHLPSAALYAYASRFAIRARLHTGGLAVGPTLHRFKDYRFRLIRTGCGSQLILEYRSGSPVGTSWGGMFVPDEKLEEVEKLLTARRSEATEAAA